jgi:signal transduction histidine kinase
MIHEVSNPLSVLDGHLQLMRAGHATPARWDAVFRSIAQISRRLRQETQGETVRQFDIVEVIAEAIEDLATLAATKSIVWNVPASPVFLTWQRARAQQILFNLLKNAVEAGESESIIDIAIFFDDDECAIAVKNRGQHIPDDVAQALFVPGWSSKSQGHLGMGLTVSRKLAEICGARLEYTDALGFVVRVPVGHRMLQTAMPMGVTVPQSSRA